MTLRQGQILKGLSKRYNDSKSNGLKKEITWQTYLLPRILYMPVLHFEHLPFIAFLPFFMVTCLASFISLLLLHFTQYPVSAILFSSFVHTLMNVICMLPLSSVIYKCLQGSSTILIIFNIECN